MYEPSLDAAQEAKKLLNGNSAIRQALNSTEAQQVLKVLQSKDSARLQAAAQAALKGDSSALSGIIGELAQNPEAGKAIERLNQRMNQQ